MSTGCNDHDLQKGDHNGYCSGLQHKSLNYGEVHNGQIVQAFYGKKWVNLKQIATKTISAVLTS